MTFSCELFSFENRPFEDVLAQKFANCELEKENVFLTSEQVKKVKKDYSEKFSSLILRFKKKCDGNFVYIDSHFVRTQNETVIIEVSKDKISDLVIASFMEPMEYLPPTNWIKAYLNKGREVDSLTGATLSQNAITKTAKKYLIIDRVLNE